MLEKLPIEVTAQSFSIAVSPCKRFEYFRDPLYTRCIGRVPANNASYEERDGLRESESPRRPAEQWRESRGEERRRGQGEGVARAIRRYYPPSRAASPRVARIGNNSANDMCTYRLLNLFPLPVLFPFSRLLRLTTVTRCI